MIESLTQFLSSFGLSWRDVLVGILLFVGTSVGGLLAVAFLLVRLPADYFCESAVRNQAQRRTAYGWAIRVAKSVLGVIVIILGILLSLPGIPGPGILTILVGVMLIDSPKKRRFERWFLGRPGVFESINDLRKRYGKPPMILDEECSATEPQS